MHLLVDSTGLKLCGAGEWLHEKHGTKTCRAWRKLHIGTDTDTGEIVAATLTTSDACDASQVGPLLVQVPGSVGSFTADGAYDWDSVYDEIAARNPDGAVVVPPRPTPGRAAWQRLRRHSATTTCKPLSNGAVSLGRRPRDTTGGPWSRPTSAGSNG